MAETIELGIVGIKNCGIYNAQTTYEKLNVVTYQGSTYCALKETKGNLPTDTSYWQLYAQKGDKGEKGGTGDVGPSGPKGEPSGSPLAAASVSAMTDTTRVYVNTTDGYWYYYNGSNWVQGGVYQATEIGSNIIGSYNISNNGLMISDMFTSEFTDSFNDVFELYNGNYYNGSPVPTINWMATKMIPVKKDDIIVVDIDYATLTLNVVELYDKNKSYIKDLSISANTPLNYTVETGVYYARFNLVKSLNNYAIRDVFSKYKINNKSIFYKTKVNSLDSVIYPYNFYNVRRNEKKLLSDYIYKTQTAWVVKNNVITNVTYSTFTSLKPITLKQGDVVDIVNVSSGLAATLVRENDEIIRDYPVSSGDAANIQFVVTEDCTGYFNIYDNDYDDYDLIINNVHIFDTYIVDWIEEKINRSIWYDKRLEIFGDSIVQGTQQQGNYVTHLSPLIKPAIFTNKGISGRPMANGTPNGVGTNTTINSENTFEYDLIIIAAGTNDFKLNVPLGELGTINDTVLNTNTFYGAYKDALNHILSINPDVRIVLWTPLQRNQAGYDIYYTNSASHKLIDYVCAIKNIGQLYGIPVIDLYSTSGVNMKTLMNYTYDGLHLSSHGYDLVCRYLKNKLDTI